MGPVEMRVLGSLIEKQRTTPDVYPLTLNTLRLACNQATNRDPVLELDDGEIRAALERLARRRWARMASGQGSRAPKYRHLLAETLELGADELSILAVLMLRGPQTPGELKGRANRMHAFADLDSAEGALERLGQRGLVRQLERRPGQKEERYAQLLGSTEDASGPDGHAAALHGDAPADDDSGEPTEAPTTQVRADHRVERSDDSAERLRRLEREVAELRDGLERLRRDLGGA